MEQQALQTRAVDGVHGHPAERGVGDGEAEKPLQGHPQHLAEQHADDPGMGHHQHVLAGMKVENILPGSRHPRPGGLEGFRARGHEHYRVEPQALAQAGIHGLHLGVGTAFPLTVTDLAQALVHPQRHTMAGGQFLGKGPAANQR